MSAERIGSDLGHCTVPQALTPGRIEVLCISPTTLIISLHLLRADDPEKELSWFEKMVTGKGSSVALAILCGKALVPIKIPVAAAVTPYVHRCV